MAKATPARSHATFTLTLAPVSGRAVTVDYATGNGSATSPADYQANGGTLNFAAGETTKTVTVLVNGDSVDEIDETFTVNLSNAPNATITDGSGQATITNDDTAPGPLDQRRRGGRGRLGDGERDVHG